MLKISFDSVEDADNTYEAVEEFFGESPRPDADIDLRGLDLTIKVDHPRDVLDLLVAEGIVDMTLHDVTLQ